MSTTKGAPSFLELPTEIRSCIYAYLLKSSTHILLTTCESEVYHVKSNFANWLASQIVATCKQIYHEAYAVLYSENEISFTHIRDILPFTRKIGETNTGLVKTVKCIGSGNPSIFLRDLARPLVALRELETFELRTRAASQVRSYMRRGRKAHDYSGLDGCVDVLNEILESHPSLGKVVRRSPDFQADTEVCLTFVSEDHQLDRRSWESDFNLNTDLGAIIPEEAWARSR